MLAISAGRTSIRATYQILRTIVTKNVPQYVLRSLRPAPLWGLHLPWIICHEFQREIDQGREKEHSPNPETTIARSIISCWQTSCAFYLFNCVFQECHRLQNTKQRCANAIFRHKCCMQRGPYEPDPTSGWRVRSLPGFYADLGVHVQRMVFFSGSASQKLCETCGMTN